MALPDFFIRSLIRVASLQGRGVLEAVVTGQFTVAAGGKVMISASGEGKAFAYQVPPGLTTDELMAKAEQALTYFDSHSSDEITSLLTSRGNRYSRARFM